MLVCAGGDSELRSCVKVEVAVLVRPVPKSHYGLCGRKAAFEEDTNIRVQELCESRGGCPGLSVPSSPYGLCGRKATFDLKLETLRAQELCESQGGHPGLPVPNSPYGLCGRKATLNLNQTSGAVRKSRWQSWAPHPK